MPKADLKKLDLYIYKKHVELLEKIKKETGCPIAETVRRILDTHFGLVEGMEIIKEENKQ